MSQMWRQRCPARRRFASPRKSLGVFLRRMASFPALERQPQGRGSVSPVRRGISESDASYQDSVGPVHSVCRADTSGPVGGIIRGRRVMTRTNMLTPYQARAVNPDVASGSRRLDNQRTP